MPTRRLAVFQALAGFALLGCKAQNDSLSSSENLVYSDLVPQIFEEQKEPVVLAVWPEALAFHELGNDREGVARTAIRDEWKSAFEQLLTLKTQPGGVSLSTGETITNVKLVSLSLKEADVVNGLKSYQTITEYLNSVSPALRSIIKFSRVGFSEDGGKSVLVIASSPGSPMHGGIGIIFMMEKRNGRWFLVKDYQLFGGP
jgi:hypothetical protein